MSDIEKAEVFGRLRATIMGMMGLLLFGGGLLALKTGAASDEQIAFGIPVWSINLLLIVLAALLIATGGGLLKPDRILALANDETTRAHRSRAVVAGFWTMLAAVMIAYTASFVGASVPMRALARFLALFGQGTALIVFAWLELRAIRG